jgi:hypothetical protein
LGALQARLAQVLVVRRVALDEQRLILLRRRDRVLVEVEHDVGNAVRAELLADSLPDAPVAADDEVVVQVLDRPLLPALGQRAREDAAGDRLEDNGTCVRDEGHAGDDEYERDDPRAVVARNRVQPGERDRDHRAVEGLEPGLVQGLPEGDRPDDERDGDRDEQPRELTGTDVRLHAPSMWPWKRTSSAYPIRIRTSGG